MNRTVLTDEQWQTIWTFLISHPRLYVGPPDTCRRFLNAVLWVLRSGAQGRSRGGFSTKIHALTDALGNPVDFVLTGGQVADITQAEALLPDEPMGAVVADKGYDANAWHGSNQGNTSASSLFHNLLKVKD